MDLLCPALLLSVLLDSSARLRENLATSLSIDAKPVVTHNKDSTSIEYTGTVVLSKLESKYLGISALITRDDTTNPPSYAGIIRYPEGEPVPGRGPKPIIISFFNVSSNPDHRTFSGIATLHYSDASKTRRAKKGSLPEVTIHPLTKNKF